MKTRLKTASAHLSQVKHKEIKKKEGPVNSNEVILAMYNLIKSSGGSLLQLKDEHCNTLAKRFKISRDNICEYIVNKTQPRVMLTEM